MKRCVVFVHPKHELLKGENKKEMEFVVNNAIPSFTALISLSVALRVVHFYTCTRNYDIIWRYVWSREICVIIVEDIIIF